MFHLDRLSDDKLKFLSRFVLGACSEHALTTDSFKVGTPEFNHYFGDTLDKVARYLRGVQQADASFSDFQCVLAGEARKLFNPTPIGYVTNGDLDRTHAGQPPPNLANGVEDEAQARHWMEVCNLRVLPVYVGDPLPPPSNRNRHFHV